MVIRVNVADKRASVIGSPVMVCGNSDYIVEFTFDKDWTGLGAKTARFVYIQAGEVKYQDVVFTGTTVGVPIMANTKEVRVGVFEGELRTSTPAVIPCELSIRCGTGAPDDPTPSQYDQIMELLAGGGGGVSFIPDETLKFENDTLSVNTIDTVKEGSKLPITSGAVFTTVGNIEVLMKTI